MDRQRESDKRGEGEGLVDGWTRRGREKGSETRKRFVGGTRKRGKDGGEEWVERGRIRAKVEKRRSTSEYSGVREKRRWGGWRGGEGGESSRRVCRVMWEGKGEEEAEGRHSLSHRARAMSGARSLVFCLRYDATASLVTAVTGSGVIRGGKGSSRREGRSGEAFGGGGRARGRARWCVCVRDREV